jgi:hypothetical protein
MLRVYKGQSLKEGQIETNREKERER